MDHKEHPCESDVTIEDVEIALTATTDVDNYHGFTMKIALVSLAVNLLAFSLLQTLVGAGAFARNVATSVGAESESVWLAQIVAIVTGALGPPVSQAADYWGRKWFLISGAVFGCIGSIIVSRGTTMGTVIAGQVISAMSFGASPLLYAGASEIVPRRFRVAAQAVLNVSSGLGGVFGLLTGEVLVSKSLDGWRLYWYLLAGEWALSGLILGLLYNPPPRPLQFSLTLWDKLRQLDWIGYFLLAIGITLFSIALSWSQNPYSWKDAHILATFVLGLFFLIALTVHQSVVQKNGMFHHDLFKKGRNFAIALVCFFIEGLAFFAANGYFSFEVSMLYETEPIRIGLRFSIVFFSAAVFSLLIGIWSIGNKRLREPTILAFLLYTLFNALMASVTLSSSNALWGYQIILGAGLGLCLSLLVTVAQLSAPPALIAISTGLIISVRSVGGSVGLAIFTAIFNSKINTNLGPDIASAVLALGLSPKVLPEFIAALASNDQKALLAIPGITPEIIGVGVQALQKVYLLSFRYLWVAAGAFSLFAATISCFLVNPKKDVSMHVDAPLEQEE